MACRAAAELIRQGKTVFSPVAYSHAICQLGLPLDWAFWERHDLAFLKMCEEVVVLTIDGWQASVGVRAEIEAARSMEKPISFLDVRRMPSKRARSKRERRNDRCRYFPIAEDSCRSSRSW